MFVVTAVALGASAGLTETTTTAVKDAYSALKGLLTRRQVDVSGLERRPDSSIQREALAETLADTPDVIDGELVGAAGRVAEAVAAEQPEAAAVIGIDLQQVKAAYLAIRAVHSEGAGVRVRQAEFSGGIDIAEVSAGRVRESGTASRGQGPLGR